MRLISLIGLIFLLSVSSCIVQAPKYAKVEQVLQLKEGMSLDEVSSTLGIVPYDLKVVNEEGKILIYKYRVTDRKTIPWLMKPANGVKTTGKWVDLFISFSKEGKVTKIESCSECGETKPSEQKININTILTFITITFPALLIYLGFN